MTLTGVRRLTVDDLDRLLALQAVTLPDTMSARFGPRFNALYHRAMLREELYYCDGYFSDGRLVGYLSYTPDTFRLLRTTFRRSALAFIATLAGSLVTHPRRTALVLRIVRLMWGRRPEPAQEIGAELLSIGVLPDFRGRTPSGEKRESVGGLLLEHALSVLRSAGAPAVKAFTVPKDPVPRAFFGKHGFACIATLWRYGSDTNLHVRHLDDRAGQNRS